MLNWLINWIRCTRYNHALEHATLHLLQQRYPNMPMLGFSDGRGITFYSRLKAEEILPALHAAQEQLRNGASDLAIHPHCGTNLVSAATLTALSTWLALASTERRSWLNRLSRAILFNIFALWIAPSLGTWMQAHVTTDAALPPVTITALLADAWGNQQRLRVNLRYSL